MRRTGDLKWTNVINQEVPAKYIIESDFPERLKRRYMELVNETSNYVMYRNRWIPRWWQDYLPDERNPYKKEDTLTLMKGCLCDYWHIHSSNKHYNPKGSEACNAVQRMVYERFGGAFLSSPFRMGYGGHQGQIIYQEPEHLLYENAYLDDGKIHIKNARQYYEDVISFVSTVLKTISSNHMQSGNDYGASAFFPSMTDSQIERAHLERQIRAEKTEIFKEECTQLINSLDFSIDEIEYSAVSFSAVYDFEVGWFNAEFSFHDLRTNIGKEVGTIKVLVEIPYLFKGKYEKKDLSKAIKTLELSYCLYLCSKSEETSRVVLPVPSEKVSAEVKKKIQEACEQAMEEYNAGHMNAIENTNCTPTYRRYPPNFFLDNEIGKIALKYIFNVGADSWRIH